MFKYRFNEMGHTGGKGYGGGKSQDRSFYAAETGVIETLGWENPSDHQQGYGYRIKLRATGDQSLFVYAHVDPESRRVINPCLCTRTSIQNLLRSLSNCSLHAGITWVGMRVPPTVVRLGRTCTSSGGIEPVIVWIHRPICRESCQDMF